MHEPGRAAGRQLYNPDHSMLQYCDGTNWIAMGPPARPALDVGAMPTDGLVGWWTLDETSGTSAADSSGNGNNGTMIGGLDAGNDSVAGQIGTALDFDGDDDISASDDNALDISSSFSLAAWIYPDTVSSGYMTFLVKGSGVKEMSITI